MPDAKMGVYVLFKRYSPRLREPQRLCYGTPQAMIRTRRNRHPIRSEGYNRFVVEACSDGEVVSKTIPYVARLHSKDSNAN